MVILGAGASKASDSDMPLLDDLPGVLNRFDPQHELGQYLSRQLPIANADIEVLLALLYQLNKYFFVPSRRYFLDREWSSSVRSSNPLLYLTSLPIRTMPKIATAILEMLRTLAAENPNDAVTFSPANFFKLFQGALHDYFQASFSPLSMPAASASVPET